MKKDNQKRKVEQWTAEKLISVFKSGKLDLAAEYQRDIIWTLEKRQLLIDSMLENIDIPKIYLAYLTKEDQYECIDGKQRINTILDFFDNLLKTKKGKLYEELSHQVRSLFLGYPLSVSILYDPTAENVSELFRRLNIGMPLNSGEQIKGMLGDMRDFIFKIGKNGPFIDKVGIKIPKKGYRFSREITVAQMVINSLIFRATEKPNNFRKARYENIREFLSEEKNKKFDTSTKKKTDKILLILKKMEKVFGDNSEKLGRKAAIVSAYLFCEEIIEKNNEQNLDNFPKFYIQLLKEMKQQADLAKKFDKPTKKILLEKFQHNLQQASAEGYSIERRHQFLDVAFDYYLKTGKIIENEKEYNAISKAKGYSK